MLTTLFGDAVLTLFEDFDEVTKELQVQETNGGFTVELKHSLIQLLRYIQSRYPDLYTEIDLNSTYPSDEEFDTTADYVWLVDRAELLALADTIRDVVDSIDEARVLQEGA